jgi:hypothetical protein
MRKIFTIISLFCIIGFPSVAQTNVLCEDFNNYDTLTAGANYNGFTLTYYSQFSYYTSVQSSGPSGPNSYKFGVDSATMITPDISGADHINFWMKGNASTGGTLANGAFYIYETSDGTNYTLIDMISPIAAFVAQTRQYALSPGTMNVKFFYDKDSGNVAFDDFCATIGAVGIKEFPQNSALSVYPNPTRGLTTIDLKGVRLINASISISNLLGKEIRTISLKGNETAFPIDLSEFQDGIYFVKVKSDAGESTKRIILRKF